MISAIKKVPIGYNGNQLAKTAQNDNFLLSIDFLIINLSIPLGTETELKKFTLASNFDFELQDFGTSIFKNRYFVYKNAVKIGSLISSPRSSILKPDFCQFQFENSLFYCLDLPHLKALTLELTQVLNASFDGINRLDVALDLENDNNFYQEVSKSILNNELIVSGREKNINSYYSTTKGKPQLNGFTIGSRTASRFLRVYNKTLEMKKKPKEYILTSWNNQKMNTDNIWRFEYQLNNKFFRFLEQKQNYNNLKSAETEKLTYQIFDINTLFLLLERATKNHFELKHNSGKSETNKEKDFILINFSKLKSKLSTITRELITLKKAIETPLLTIKRQIKSNFREYFNSEQKNISYILAFNQLFEDYDTNFTQLTTWFKEKKHFYLQEFQKKQRFNTNFDNVLFQEHCSYSI